MKPATIPNLPFSVIIAVYNDWAPLDQCLDSLAQQVEPPNFEVIVIDDGSKDSAPQFIRRWIASYPMTVVRQPHTGISAARNHGVRVSRGSILLFVDADCNLDANCLCALHSAITAAPQHKFFQLRLTGDCSRLVGKSEQLRLQSIQDHQLQPDGRIQYLNTSGFALRAVGAEDEEDLFNPSALRAEDTLLLAQLLKVGDAPLFVGNAIVQHAIPLSLVQCLLKDIRSAYLEGETYALIAAMGVGIRVSFRERLQILRFTWKIAGASPAGRSGWVLFVIRTILQRLTSVSYPYLRPLFELPRASTSVLKNPASGRI